MSWNWEPQQRLQVVRQVADTRGSLRDIHGDRVSDVTSVKIRRDVAVTGVVGDAVGGNVAVALNDPVEWRWTLSRLGCSTDAPDLLILLLLFGPGGFRPLLCVAVRCFGVCSCFGFS